MTVSKLGRLFLASLVVLNGMPVLGASGAAPTDRSTALKNWANAVGMSGDNSGNDEITSLEYWGTGTITLHGQLCTLTDYHASIKYQVPGMRVDFACVDVNGQSHHEIQVVAGNVAWNEAEPGNDTSAMETVSERLTDLWTGPLALVRAAAAAGANTRVTAEDGKIVLRFAVPGVADATVKATLSARNQAEQAESRLGAVLVQTTFSDYTELNGSDLRFDTFFPRHIVQRQGDKTLLDLTVTKTSAVNVDLVMTAPENVRSENVASRTDRRPPSTWKDKRSWSKLDESLHRTFQRGCVTAPSVIIRTKAGYRGGLRDSLNAHGNTLSGEFSIIDALAASVSCDDLQTVAGFDSTLSISVNARVISAQMSVAPPSDVALAPRATTTPVPIVAGDLSPRESEGLAAALLQAPMLQTLLGDNYEQIRSKAFSTTIGIAIIDSGIEAGPDFGDRITAFYDFTQGDVRAAAPSDAYGHGTHVAGLAASRFVGVDPNARLVGLKVLNELGQGNAAETLRAIEFAVVNKDLLNIQVLNLSLGHPIYELSGTDPLVQAVESAVRAGLVVVVSAGNFGLNPTTGRPGYAGIASPGNAPSAYSIGAVRTFNTATRDDDRIALFSSRGPSWFDGFVKPDFSAPGQNILSVAAAGSTLRRRQEAAGNTGNYMRLSGTSMSAGIVSGFVSLALEINPGLSPNALKAVLEYSAIDVKSLAEDGSSADLLTQGAGAISGGALELARGIDTSAPVGAHWLTASVPTSTHIARRSMPWVQRLIWGNSLAIGNGLVAERRPAWALNIVWGNGPSGGNIVWGNSLPDDNIVWGNTVGDDNIVWGNSLGDDNIVWGNSIDGDNGDNIVWGNSADSSSADPPAVSSGDVGAEGGMTLAQLLRVWMLGTVN
jgi:serine protease AprX